MRWNCMSKALRFLQITAEHQDCTFFTVFLTTKSLSQNILITFLQISLKLHEHRGSYWRKKLLRMILEKLRFSVPRNTTASKMVLFCSYNNSDVFVPLIITNLYSCGGHFSKSLLMVTYLMLKPGRYWTWKTPSSYPRPRDRWHPRRHE